MLEKLKKLVRTKTGKILIGCVLVLVLYTAAHSTAVTVTNYPYLMQLAQRTITDSIRSKIQEVWQKEVASKLEAGFIRPAGLAMPNATTNMSTWTDTFISDYKGGYFGNNSAWYAQLAKKNTPIAFPTPAEGVGSFQKQVRDVSIAIQGLPSGLDTGNLGTFYKQEFTGRFEATKDRAAAEKYALMQVARHKKVALDKTAAVAASEAGFEGIYMGDAAKKELAKINPGSFDSISSDRAVKDLAKIMHYNAVLQAQMLKVMSAGEVRSAIHSSAGR